MREYSFIFTDENLTLLHFHPPLKKSITSVNSKLNIYLDIECEQPSEYSITKIKSKYKYHGIKTNNYNKLSKNNLYIGKIVNNKIILMPVDGYYHMERYYTENIVKNKESKKHNDILNRIDSEPPVELEYKIEIENRDNKIIEEYKNKNIKEDNKEKTKTQVNLLKRIKDSIFRRKIVNYNTLIHIFKDKILINNLLNKLTVYFNGRYILKTEFYNKNLQNVRNKMLEKMKESFKTEFYNKNLQNVRNKMVENMKESYYDLLEYNELLKDNIHLFLELVEINKEKIEEIYKNNRKYTLKGYYEENINNKEEDRIIIFLERKNYCTYDEIKRFNNLEEYIKEGTIVKLSNECFALKKHENKIKEAIIEILSKKKTLRKKEVEIKLRENNIEMESSEFLNIIKTFCISKGSNWHIKEL